MFALLLLIVILQHPFQVGSLIEYLPCKLRVGNNLPVPIVLQRARADIQPIAYFLTCEEVLTAKERLVCLCYFLNSLAYSADSGQHHLYIVRFHIQISYQFHNLRVYFNVSSTNSEQCKLCVNGPLHIDARLLWEQIMGSNCPE